MKWIFFLVIVLTMSVTLPSCGGDDDEVVDPEVAIAQYIADNQLTTTVTASGLNYVILTEGDGEHPTISNVVTVHYQGRLLNGTVFDATDGVNPAQFSLQEVIPGWQEGIPLFSRGGSGVLIIPPSLAYGSAGQGPIPPNTPILFDVALVDF